MGVRHAAFGFLPGIAHTNYVNISAAARGGQGLQKVPIFEGLGL
jgi:hypothetical protein